MCYHYDSCAGKEIPEDELAQRMMLYADADHILHKVLKLFTLGFGCYYEFIMSKRLVFLLD
jgi:hypothetical protein